MTKTRQKPDQSAPPAPADRAAALAILEGVLNHRQPLDAVLPKALSDTSLSDKDKKFAQAAALAVLKHRRGLMAIVDRMMDKPLTTKAKQIPHILHLGLAQILLMDVADHAAVDATVRLAAAARHPQERRFKALVNAILRRAVREREDLMPMVTDPLCGLPDWILAAWQSAYGPQTTTEIGEALQRRAPTDVTLKDPTQADMWAKRLRSTALPTGSIRLADRGNLEALPGYSTGEWWVQDAAAALPARLLGDVNGAKVADLCAAPGGKTMQLAAAGAHVMAVDRAEARLERLRDNLKRTRLGAEVVVADAGRWRPDEPVDHILLDAPCSTTGTLRRHPDVAWLKSPEDVQALIKTQDALLDHAAALLPLGGRLVYCVCSLQPEEGEDRVRGFLSRHDSFVRLPVTQAEMPGLPAGSVTAEGDVRTLPNMWADEGGMDGFFIARLTRRA